MITPLFSIRQTATTLQLNIRAPHSRPKDIEISVDQTHFHFYTSPYLLHLNFEHPVQLPSSSNSSFVSYNFTTGIATVTLQKFPPHPHFERLDMLSTLLVTRPTERQPPSIQVLSTTTTPPTDQTISDKELSLENQMLHPLRELSITRPSYGFALRYEGLFAVRSDDVRDIVSLPHPDSTPVWRRRSLRVGAENLDFNLNHYIADWLLEEEFDHVLAHIYHPPDTAVPMQDDWIQMLVNLPAREYLPAHNQAICADLAGILYSVCYDSRITMGERCVESPWTVSRVCASMAWLESFKIVSDAVAAAFQRVLVYPLYRHYGLAQLVLADLKQLVAGEVDVLRARLLRIFLEMRTLFEADPLLRLFCDLYWIDYSIWVQKVDNDVLRRFQSDISELEIRKIDVRWDLDAIEERAVRMADGELEEEQIEVEGDFLRESPINDTESKDQRLEVASELEKGEVTISALSPFPRDELKITPVETRMLGAEDSSKRRRENLDATEDQAVCRTPLRRTE
eukprot:GFKZ01009439.1.p1 GENE.GFKZ01009439.1~~GFKZ01009439.1.p1  ORF type:complete len:532 (-),score=61.34 GFKZ01009439.1:1185-2717(-)